MKTKIKNVLIAVALLMSGFSSLTAQTIACPYGLSNQMACQLDFTVTFYALDPMLGCVPCTAINVNGVQPNTTDQIDCATRATACAGLGAICGVTVVADDGMSTPLSASFMGSDTGTLCNGTGAILNVNAAASDVQQWP